MRADCGACCGLAYSNAGWSLLVSTRPNPSCAGCARYGKRYESPMFAVYSVGTCIDEDSGAHHRGRQRRVSSAERTRAASALIPFRASWLKAGRGKRGRFSRPWRAPSVIGANEAGGSRRCASVNQGSTASLLSSLDWVNPRPKAKRALFYWPHTAAIGKCGKDRTHGNRGRAVGVARARWPPSNRLRTLPRSRRCAWRCWARPAR